MLLASFVLSLFCLWVTLLIWICMDTGFIHSAEVNGNKVWLIRYCFIMYWLFHISYSGPFPVRNTSSEE